MWMSMLNKGGNNRHVETFSPATHQVAQLCPPIGIKLRKEEVKRSKGKLASGERIQREMIY
jgi:hypothetical protein